MREGWQERQLGQVLHRRTERLGVAPEPRILTVTEGRGLVDQMVHWGRRVATENVSDYKVVEPGDVVYNVYLLWNGAIGQNLFSDKGVTSPVYEVFTPTADVESRYLGLLLESPMLRGEFDRISIGSIQRRRRAPWQDFERIKVQLPSLSEQRRIVDLVGALDDAISACQHTRRRLEGALAKSRDARPVGMPTTVGELVSAIVNGLTTTSADQATGDGRQHFVKASAIEPGQFVPTEIKLAPNKEYDPKYSVRLNDILMTRINTPERVGHLARVDAATTGLLRPDLVWRLEIRADRVIPDFLVHSLSGPKGRELISAAAPGTSNSMKQISKGRFLALPIDLPSLAAQREYVDRCEALRSCIAVTAEEHDSLRGMRSALLMALLSGEHEIPKSYDELMGVAS